MHGNVCIVLARKRTAMTSIIESKFGRTNYIKNGPQSSIGEQAIESIYILTDYEI